MMHRISVIMSVYKEPVEWLHESIDSILNQTFTDFEFIIICDNPSYNEGIALLHSYKEKDDRIVIIENEQNIGLTKSLNKGLAVAKGEYIARMDADDISMPNRFEHQITYLDKNTDLVAIGSSVSIIDEKGRKTGTMRHKTNPIYLKSISMFESPIFHPTAVIRRIIDDNPFFYDDHFEQAQDYALWSKLLIKHNISNLDEILLKYRITKQNISQQKRKNQNLYAIEIQKTLFENLKVQISDQDRVILSSVFKNEALRFSNQDIINAIRRLKDYNENIETIDIYKTVDYVIFLFCNYLPSYYSIWTSLFEFMKVTITVKQFRIYNILSLLNKFRLIGSI